MSERIRLYGLSYAASIRECMLLTKVSSLALPRAHNHETLQRVLLNLRALKKEPPAPPPRPPLAERVASHREAALAYRLSATPDTSPLRAATWRRPSPRRVGNTYNKPNVDLAAGICSTAWAGATICSTTI